MKVCPLSGPSCKRNIVMGNGPYKKPKCPLTDPPDCPYKQERCPLLPPLPPCPSEKPLVTMSAEGVPIFNMPSSPQQAAVSNNLHSSFLQPASNNGPMESSATRECPCSGGKSQPSPPCPMTPQCPPCPPCSPCPPPSPPPCCPLSKSSPETIPSPCCPPPCCPKPCCPPPCPPPALPLSLPDSCPPLSCCSPPPPCCPCQPSTPKACPPPGCKPCCSPICSVCKPSPCPTLKCCCPLCLTLCPSSPPIPSLCPCDKTKCPLKSKACILTKDSCPLVSPKCPPPCTWLPEPSPMLPNVPPLNSASCSIGKDCPFENVPLTLCDNSCPCGKEEMGDKKEECCPYAPKHLLASLSQKPTPFRELSTETEDVDTGRIFHLPTCPLSSVKCSVHPSVAQIPTTVPICPFYPEPCPLGDICPYPLPPNITDIDKQKSVKWSDKKSPSNLDESTEVGDEGVDKPPMEDGVSENYIEVLKRKSSGKGGGDERKSTNSEQLKEKTSDTRASNPKEPTSDARDSKEKEKTSDTRGSNEKKKSQRGSKEEKGTRESKEGDKKPSLENGELEETNDNEVRTSMAEKRTRASKDQELLPAQAAQGDEKEATPINGNETRSSKDKNGNSLSQEKGDAKAETTVEEPAPVEEPTPIEEPTGDAGQTQQSSERKPLDNDRNSKSPEKQSNLIEREDDGESNVMSIQSEPIKKSAGFQITPTKKSSCTQSEPRRSSRVKSKTQKSTKTSSLQGYFETEEDVTKALCRNLKDCPGWGNEGKKKKRSRRDTREDKCPLMDVMRPRPCPCYPPVPVCPLASMTACPGKKDEGSTAIIQCPYMPTAVCPKAPPPKIKVNPCPGFIEPQI